MTPIPLERLLLDSEREGPHGAWRKSLREGYAPEEPYFEFGVMPEQNPEFGDFRIILDHKFPVRLCPESCPFVGEYVIRPGGPGAVDTVREGDHGFRFHTFFVSPEEYRAMCQECRSIHSQYGYDEGISFWSIPDKWFSETMIMSFIKHHITSTEYYIRQPRSRTSFYWP